MYLKSKTNQYHRLRDTWKDMFSKCKETDEMKFVVNMVKKDVLRTDRTHSFYAGADDSANVLSLFNLLVTYALTHPEVSYCQGMSDLASPILVVQKDEAHAYICFCGLMTRLKSNFLLDGIAMTTRFKHLSILLQHQDPDFFAYLEGQNAHDLFFCYRWLLLELKREFPFEDALFLLEVMWSTLPPNPPETELELVDHYFHEHGFGHSPSSPSLASQAYMRLKSLRQHSCDATNEVNGTDKSGKTPSLVQSQITSPVEEGKYLDSKVFLDSATAQSLEAQASQIDQALHSPSVPTEDSSQPKLDPLENVFEEKDELPDPGRITINGDVNHANNRGGAGEDTSHTFQHSSGSESGSSQHSPCKPASPKRPTDINLKQTRGGPGQTRTRVQSLELGGEQCDAIDSCEEATDKHPSIDFVKVPEKPSRLPAPAEFGHGNAFLMFLCVALLLQQRDYIVSHHMDYNEIAMLFDKMVRRNNLHKILHTAKCLYATYLKSQQYATTSDTDDLADV